MAGTLEQARTDLSKLIEAGRILISERERDDFSEIAQQHWDRLVARIQKDWEVR